MFNDKEILIVEDEKDFSAVLQDVLQYDFSKVHVAQNAYDAIEIFKKESPHIVLSDINLPRINGLALAEQIRILKQDQPILFMTAFQSIYDLRGVKYIQKPITFEVLYERIKELLL